MDQAHADQRFMRHIGDEDLTTLDHEVCTDTAMISQVYRYIRKADDISVHGM